MSGENRRRHSWKHPVPMRQWAKDHWSTFAYLETIAVDVAMTDGVPDNRRMRCDPDRHPGLALRQHTMKKYPTRLNGGKVRRDHDDWDCVDDMVAAGLITTKGTGVHPVIVFTEAGMAMAAKLREYKAAGGQFAAFEPDAVAC